jgi:predicted metal-dependent hydrolase
VNPDQPLPGFEPTLPFDDDPIVATRLNEQPVADEPFTVQVVRSAQRRRTVGAELRGGTLIVRVPMWMSRAEEAHWVDKMSASFRRKLSSDRINLTRRAASLARRHELPHPREIRWADDMTSRWGSCTYSTGTVRISNRLAAFPDWVIDYVIVHELCHLEVRGHGPDFWRLVHRYPKAERAIGYLIAKAGDDEHGLDDG